MATEMSVPIPIPQTQHDEEQQLEFAIMRSLEENYSPHTSVQDFPPMNTSQVSEFSTEEEPRSTNQRKRSSSRPIPAPYRRSRTMPSCGPFSHSRSPNTPTLTLNPARARSFDYSPPRPTYSTDCCEVRDEIILENKAYLENLTKTESNVNPPVHIAIRRDHFDCLDGIIGALPELVMSRDTNGKTPLFVAVTEGNSRMARRLVAAGVSSLTDGLDRLIGNFMRTTAIWCALISYSLRDLIFPLHNAFQADVNVGRQHTDTPLQAAIESGSRELARLLLKSGANPNKPMNRGWTAVHECVYMGNSELLELILNFGGDPNIRDMYGVSPVFTSAACGRNECLDILLRAGGDPNLPALSKAASPLYEACKEVHIDCALTLLEHGADPHIVNCDGLYPLHMACQKGCIQLVEELLKVTDKSLVENCGLSPMHSAAQEDEIEILEMLIDRGYDVNIKITKDKISYRDRRQTALFFAVFNDSEEAAEMLLKAGAKTDLDYVKPLLVAESHRQYGLVDLLIKYGADINASFAEERVFFPATAAFAMKDPTMFRKILLSGCDASRCFTCPLGEEDHSQYAEETQNKAFCHFVAQERNRDWAGWAVFRLLRFVNDVKLCRRMREVLEDSDEWEAIKLTVGSPRCLTHLCRLKIRQVAKKSEFERVDLPLPLTLLHFLNHENF